MSCSGSILANLRQFDCLQDDLRQASKRHWFILGFGRVAQFSLNITSLSTACRHAEFTCHFTVINHVMWLSAVVVMA